ncbi:MAG TPA: SDR family oxidoreductase [Candidatus Sabulitectum sp.]|nr:SDR family oxidoreductase [Candidatus Sabulitectum sp.]HPR23512.1 SDR family oxidoreductase [Candidatus Sabulitectum sp.]
MDQPVLVTGATGFLGGFIAAELARRGVPAVLAARAAGGRSPGERVSRLFRFLDTAPGKEPVILPLDLLAPDLGLSSGERGLLAGVPSVIHCAADTSFALRRGEQVRATNLDGLENLFSCIPGCRRFCLMSTAYAAGTLTGTILEEPLDPPGFNNPYEESKNLAEKLAADICEARGTELVILRPSITCGHSVTGRSLRFNALYYPVRTFMLLRDSMRRDILEKGGGRAEAMGVSIDPSGGVNLPVNLPGGGSLNLISIDYLVAATVEILRSRGTGVFHLVNPLPSSVEEVTGHLSRYYGISGIRVSRERGRGPLQTLVDRYMEVYYPYFCDSRVFDSTRTAAQLSESAIRCPEFSSDVFRSCMDFAMACGWGEEVVI